MVIFSPQSLFDQIREALKKVDVVVSSGGVSMGEKDIIKEVLYVDLQAQVKFARVFMKPG